MITVTSNKKGAIATYKTKKIQIIATRWSDEKEICCFSIPIKFYLEGRLDVLQDAIQKLVDSLANKEISRCSTPRIQVVASEEE